MTDENYGRFVKAETDDYVPGGKAEVEHPENLIGHLVNDHKVRPWSILGSRIGQEEQHRHLHEERP